MRKWRTGSVNIQQIPSIICAAYVPVVKDSRSTDDDKDYITP